jgi:hypothetical protein
VLPAWIRQIWPGSTFAGCAVTHATVLRKQDLPSIKTRLSASRSGKWENWRELRQKGLGEYNLKRSFRDHSGDQSIQPFSL